MTDTITIDGRPVGTDEPAYVIAEAGSNHNGDLSLAKQLVEVAADAGADAVKFQTFRAEDLYVEESGRVDYLDDNRSIYEIIEDKEMPYEWIPELHDHCRSLDIHFLSTPFDERSADELDPYVPAFKVASYTMSHHTLLEHLASKGKPLVMSTGAHDLEEVSEAVERLSGQGFDSLVLLQCVAAYPTPIESINVRVLETLREAFETPTGLSDHTLDPVTAPSAAVALGAAVVEKHFTLDSSMEGPDHQFALEPDDLQQMIEAVRRTESALGNGAKVVQDIEQELHDVARRRIHATRPIEAGETITEENISILRSGHRAKGLKPKFYEEVLGSIAATAIEKDEGITWDALER